MATIEQTFVTPAGAALEVTEDAPALHLRRGAILVCEPTNRQTGDGLYVLGSGEVVQLQANFRDGYFLTRGDGDRETITTIEAREVIAARVVKARAHSLARQDCLNGQLDGDALKRHARPGKDGWALLERAEERFRLSPRAAYRVLKVSRTIADMAGAVDIGAEHVAEALSLRLSFGR